MPLTGVRGRENIAVCASLNRQADRGGSEEEAGLTYSAASSGAAGPAVGALSS
jgi:hypothetical protein